MVKIRENLSSQTFRSKISTELRNTNGTSIFIILNSWDRKICNNTGINYLDHLLEQFSKHGSIDLNIILSWAI